MKPYLLPAILTLLSIAGACSGSHSDKSADAIADSLRQDSLMRLKTDSAARALADSLRLDSLRADSLRADSIFLAHALRFDDFYQMSGGTIALLDETTIVNNLKQKGFETVSTTRVQASFDPSDPEGDNFPTMTNYRMADGADSLPTTSSLSILNSEAERPISINFSSDRQRDIFINSLKENGFAADHTGTLAHRSNTQWHGATATESGRRVVLESIWTY